MADLPRTGHPVTDALALREAGRHAEAIPIMDAALAEGSKWRDDPDVWRMVALLATDAKDFGRARDAYTKALKDRPLHPVWYQEATMVHLACGEWAMAAECAEQAWNLCEVGDVAPNAPVRLAIALDIAGLAFRAGHVAAGTAWLKRAAACETLTAHQRYQQSMALLLLDDYAAGLAAYEDREAFLYMSLDNPPNLPRWTLGQRGPVVVLGEQGAGDVLQMLRYLPMLAEAAGEPVVVRTVRELHPLVAAMPGVRAVLDQRADVDDCAWQIPAMSLMHAFGMARVADAPPPVAPAGFAWAPRHGVPRRIGVCWSGSKKHSNNFDRSSPWVHLGQLGQLLPGCTLVVLQPDVPAPLADERPGVWELPALPDYAATARVMQGLDAVLTVDTSVAHLAGTLGVPTWCLVPSAPEWRWGVAGVNTPWYPSMRLVRRRTVDDWRLAWRQAAQACAKVLRVRGAA